MKASETEAAQNIVKQQIAKTLNALNCFFSPLYLLSEQLTAPAHIVKSAGKYRTTEIKDAIGINIAFIPKYFISDAFVNPTVNPFNTTVARLPATPGRTKEHKYITQAIRVYPIRDFFKITILSFSPLMLLK